MEARIHLVMKTSPMSNNKLEEYKEAIATDTNLQLLNVWPKNIPSSLKSYTSFQDEITTAKGLILKNSKIVVPTKLREQVQKLIHAGYLSIENISLELGNTYTGLEWTHK